VGEKIDILGILSKRNKKYQDKVINNFLHGQMEGFSNREFFESIDLDSLSEGGYQKYKRCVGVVLITTILDDPLWQNTLSFECKKRGRPATIDGCKALLEELTVEQFKD